MPSDDFLIKFRVDNRNALKALATLKARALEVEAILNRVGVRTQGAQRGPSLAQQALAAQRAAAAQRNLAQANLANARAQGVVARTANAQAVAQSRAAAAAARAQRALFAQNTALDKVINNTVRHIRDMQLIGRGPQAGQLTRGVGAAIDLTNLTAKQLANAKAAGASAATIGRLQASYDSASGRLRNLTNVLNANRFAFDSWTRTFGHHAQRIAEGLIIYNAFAKAIDGVTAALRLVAQTDLEMERLSQVLGGITESEADSFLKGLGDIAVETNTDISALVSTTDLIAGALSNLPEGQQQEGILGLQRIAGEFSNVLGNVRDQEQVAQELFGLFRLLNFDVSIEGIQEFRQFLDFVVTAGHRSAFEIQSINDGLLQTGATAGRIGLDFGLLAFAIDDLVAGLHATGDAGGEVGTKLNNILGKLGDPEVLESLGGIANGLISVKDAAGNLRSATDIVVQISEAIRSGALSADEQTAIFDLLKTPLQPGSIGLVEKFFGAIGVGLERMRTEGPAAADALQELSDVFVQSLAGRFGAFIQRIKTGVLAVRHDIEDFLGSLLGFGNRVLDFFAALGPDLSLGIIKFLAFIGSAKLVLLVLSKFALLLTSLSASLTLAAARTALFATSATAAGVATGQMALGLGLASRASLIFGAAVNTLKGALSRFLPILLAFAAIEIGAQLIDNANQITQLRDEFGLSEQAAQSVVAGGARGPGGQVFPLTHRQFGDEGIQNELARFGVGAPGGRGGAKGPQQSQDERIADQLQNVRNLAIAQAQLEEQGQATAESQRAMEEAVRLANEANTVAVLTSSELVEAGLLVTETVEDETLSYQDLLIQLGLGTDAMNELTAAEQIANDALEIQAQLADEAGEAIQDLSDRYKDGKITLDEFNQGLSIIETAQGDAATLVSAYGDELREVIPELAAAATGNDALAAELFNMILMASQSGQAISDIIRQLVTLATTEMQVANAVRRNPIVVTTVFATVRGDLRGGFFSGDDPQSSTQKGRNTTVKTLVSDVNAQIKALFDALANIFRTAPGPIFGSGGGVATPAKGPERGILDIGDLTPAQLAQAVALARQLQNAIPGANAEAAGSIIDVIKDAKFLQTIQGLDQRLLQIALDELTDQIEESNRLEKEKLERESALRNLVVNTGPLGALISQPTLFGVGGSLAQGNGLNFDPTKGNFIINVPVELSGLEPAKLQQLIYDIISKAISDAMRT